MKFNAQRIPKMYKVNKTFRLKCKKKKKNMEARFRPGLKKKQKKLLPFFISQFRLSFSQY